MKTSTMRQRLSRLLVPGFWVGFWWIISRLVKNPILLPGPRLVFIELINILTTKEDLVSIFLTSYRILRGLVFGLGLGLILGIFSTRFSRLKKFIDLPISFIKASPLASITVILLIWISHRSLTSYLVALVVLPNIYTSTVEGFNSVDQKKLELREVFNLSFFKSLRYIYLEDLKKALIPSLIISIGLAFKSGISAEVLGLVNNSIGENIYYSKLYLDTRSLFAWVLIIVGLAKLIEFLALEALRRFTR